MNQLSTKDEAVIREHIKAAETVLALVQSPLVIGAVKSLTAHLEKLLTIVRQPRCEKQCDMESVLVKNALDAQESAEKRLFAMQRTLDEEQNNFSAIARKLAEVSRECDFRGQVLEDIRQILGAKKDEGADDAAANAANELTELRLKLKAASAPARQSVDEDDRTSLLLSNLEALADGWEHENNSVRHIGANRCVGDLRAMVSEYRSNKR